MTRVLFLPLLFATLLLSSCDEELPPVNNPEHLFTSYITAEYVYQSDTRPTRSSINIYLVLKNQYDETISDFAQMSGSISIEWIAPPERRGANVPTRTDHLNLDNLFRAEGFEFATNKISINPRDSVVLLYQWDLKTDDSTHLLSQFNYTVDQSCLVNANANNDLGYRSISGKEKFIIRSSVQVFRKSGTVYVPSKEVSLCFVAANFGERGTCDKINPINPCSSLP